MPRDRAACDKAIREAWKRERELVLAGKGTRDWNQEQQLEIIELGKVFDDDGIAFEGQHMKSVAAYPEHQGNPDNIQLLSVNEHLAAHKGNWKNPTNWYYDPVTFKFDDFGDADPVACKAIELSQPFAVGKKSSIDEAPQRASKEEPAKGNSPKAFSPERNPAIDNVGGYKHKRKKGFWERAWDNIVYYGGKAVGWVKEHPWETAGIVAGSIGAGVAGHELHKRHKNISSNNQISIPINRSSDSQPRKNNDFLQRVAVDAGKRLGESIQQSDGIVDSLGKQLQNHGTVIADGLSECSKLFSMGYSTRKSLEERHAILDSFVSTDGVERARKHLQFLINTRSAMKNGIYEKAVAKWLEDLDYLSGK